MNRSRSSHLLLLGCASLLLGACVQSGSGGGSTLNLEQQVQQHDMQLRQLQPAQADAWNQLQAMRQELNTLKGQMDDLQNAGGARALVERVNRHDAALRQVESSMALNLNLGDPLPSTPVSAAAPTTPAVPMTGTANTPSYGQPEATYGQPAQGGLTAGSPCYTAAVPAGTQP